jgi:hypothetical protein
MSHKINDGLTKSQRYALKHRHTPEYRAAASRKMQEYRKAHPDRELNARLKYSYGISLDDYDEMFKNQGGVCAICGRTNGSQRLVVHHDHDSGNVICLLCTTCNVILGMCHEDKEQLMKIVIYLERMSGDPCLKP